MDSGTPYREKGGKVKATVTYPYLFTIKATFGWARDQLDDMDVIYLEEKIEEVVSRFLENGRPVLVRVEGKPNPNFTGGK